MRDIPGLGSQSARCNGRWRGEAGEGGLLGEDWVLLAIDASCNALPKG